jgi:hypothetical protein
MERDKVSWRPRRRWDNAINTGCVGIGCQSVYWIELVSLSVLCQASVNTVPTGFMKSGTVHF